MHTTSAAVAQSEAFTADASAWKFWLTSLASAGSPSVNVFGIVTWACAELAALSRSAMSRSVVRSMIRESLRMVLNRYGVKNEQILIING